MHSDVYLCNAFAKKNRKERKLWATCITKHHTVEKQTTISEKCFASLLFREYLTLFLERIWPLAQCDWLEFFPCSGFEPLPTMEPTFGQPYEGWDSALTSPLCQSKPLFRIKTLALFQIFTPLSQPSGLENVSGIMRGSRCERLALECSQALISPFTGPGARGAAVTLAPTSREVWLRNGVWFCESGAEWSGWFESHLHKPHWPIELISFENEDFVTQPLQRQVTEVQEQIFPAFTLSSDQLLRCNLYKAKFFEEFTVSSFPSPRSTLEVQFFSKEKFCSLALLLLYICWLLTQLIFIWKYR